MNHKYAHFFHRLLAYTIDNTIYLLINLSVLNLVVRSNDIPQLAANLLLFIIVLLSPLALFHSIFFTQWFGGTIGKLLTGIKITSSEGIALSFKRILFRQTIGYMFSSLLFGLGYFAIFKTDKRQGWHDLAIGSLVIKTGNYWILGLVVLLSMFGALGYFGTQTVKTALANDSLKQSFTQLINDYQETKRLAGLDIRSEPKATVFINGEQKGETPFVDEKMAPGEYKISLKTTDPSAINWEGSITLVRGHMVTLSRDLHRDVIAGETIELKEGSGITISSNPSEAIVIIDNKEVGKTPYTDNNLAIGEHEIILEKPGSGGRVIKVNVIENYQTHLYMELGKESSVQVSNQNQTQQTATPKPVSAAEKAESINYWQDELTYLNQESANLPNWIGSDKDQTKIQRMVTIVNEQKAFATKALNKSQRDETFTQAEANEAKKYAQLTEEYNKLLDEVFPR
jgi:uncharacterized RDD family membrane protein YckC